MSLVRICRVLIHFGPWRHFVRAVIRLCRPVAKVDTRDAVALLEIVDPDAVAERVRESSVAVGGMLPADFIRRLRVITDKLPVDDYQLVHHIDDDIRRLSSDSSIRRVLLSYFGCEPELLECTLMVTGPHRCGGGIQNSFHFDYAGWHSLNVFVYLSDVGVDSSCHVVAKGSHGKIGVRDLLRATVSESEIERRFGLEIESIVGPAGTVFFENTEAFHRRIPSKERRVMLNMLYASHRGMFSYGRTTRDHARRRALAYEQWRRVS